MLGCICTVDAKMRPQLAQTSVSTSRSRSMWNSLSVTTEPSGPAEGRGSEGFVVVCLVGLEARTHGHRQHRQRSEGVHDLLEHEISFLSGQ
jgi:hypothetical protein